MNEIWYVALDRNEEPSLYRAICGDRAFVDGFYINQLYIPEYAICRTLAAGQLQLAHVRCELGLSNDARGARQHLVD